MFSIRDLRAINLLHRLDRTGSIGEEQRVLQELGGAHSGVPADDLLVRLSSPSYVIRSEALRALERMPRDRRSRANSPLERRIAGELVAHLRQHEFTTAYLAARIIGQWGLTEGVPALREAIGSEDYHLSSRAVVALARIGDIQSIPRIEIALRSTRNPLLLIHGAEALKLFDHRPSITLLLDILRREANPPYIRDEMVFAIAGLFHIEDWFYPHYRRFLESRTDAVSVLEEEMKSAQLKEPAAMVIEGLKLIEQNRRDAAVAFSRVIASLTEDIVPEVPNDVLIHSLEDPRLFRFERAVFFFGGLLVYRFSRRLAMPPGPSLAP
jgi:HEAT repeat protein